MNQEPSGEMLYLMLRFFDGTIEQAEFEMLNRLIKESQEIRSLYFRYLKVYLAMKNARYLDKSGHSDLDLENFLSELGQYESLAPAAAVEAPTAEPVCLPKLTVQDTPYRFNKYSFYTALTALAATILFIATIYFLPPRVIPTPVARILDSSHARWLQDKTSKSPSILFEGALTVTEGTLKFAMYDGTEVNLSAPGVIELEQVDRLFLKQGRLRAAVPPAATGFTVRTPSGSIVDFGTDFSVAVDTAGKTEVEVFKGIVELRDSTNPLIYKSAQKLTMGQKGTIAPGGMISWTEPAQYHNNGEIRVQWLCPEAVGYWNNPAFWNNGLVRGGELVSEFRAADSPKIAVVDARAAGANKIMARRGDVGLLSSYPFTIQMDGGQVQLEQLWVGRMGLSDDAEGRWLMSDGELVLKGRDLTMLFIGDKCKGLMEINGGRVEVFGAVRVGCNEGAGTFGESHGTLAVNGGEMTIYGILEVAAAESVGVVRLHGGQVRAFDIRIAKKGTLAITDGILVLEGNKKEHIQEMVNSGLIHSDGRQILVDYTAEDTRGFGRDKTIIRVEQQDVPGPVGSSGVIDEPATGNERKSIAGK